MEPYSKEGPSTVPEYVENAQIGDLKSGLSAMLQMISGPPRFENISESCVNRRVEIEKGDLVYHILPDDERIC